MSAISNEESPQILDYDIITLKAGKSDGDTDTENYTPTDVLRKPTSKKKSKWWIAIIVIGILAVLGAIVFFVYKKIKNKDVQKTKGESKEDEENKKEELPKTENPTPQITEEKVHPRDNNPDE